MELKDLKDLIKFVEKTGFAEFEYENDNERIYLSKAPTNQNTLQPILQQPQVYQQIPQKQDVREIASEDVKEITANSVSTSLGGKEITSPIVGTFYEASAPGAEPFAKEGDTIKKGQTLCIVEAMKIMNEIEAEFDCKIIKKLAVNAQPVEYGEPLFIVETI